MYVRHKLGSYAEFTFTFIRHSRETVFKNLEASTTTSISFLQLQEQCLQQGSVNSTHNRYKVHLMTYAIFTAIQ